MREFIRNSLLVINIISFIIVFIIGAASMMGELFGYDKARSLLKSLNIPLSADNILLVGLICLMILILSYFLRKKYFG